MLLKTVRNLFRGNRAQHISDAGIQGNIHQAGGNMLVINSSPDTSREIKKTFTIHELFLKKKGSRINARDILLFRAGHNANFNENFYLDRKDIDTTLSRNVFCKRHSLIVGKPLSGKSRAIYELIKRDLQQYAVYIPKDFTHGDDADIDISFDVVEDPSYFIICDLHDFLKKAAGISILKKLLLQEHIIIIADCRKERFDFVSDNMAELLELFSLIDIKGISTDIKQRLKFSLKENFREGDDTIGSYFLDITAMRRFYEKELGYEEKEVLRSYKALHHLWGQKLIAKTDLIDYTVRRFEKHYNKKEEFSLAQWDTWFQTLTKYGFIKLEGQFLLSEETYLENIIASEEKAGIFQDEVISFYPNISTFNQLLHNAEVFFEVNRILNKLYSTGIRLEMTTYTILLSKCESLVEAEEIFNKMQREGIRPDQFTYNTLLSKCQFYGEARELFEKMRADGIAPNQFTCETLLLKCGTFIQARKVLSIMKEYQLKPGIMEYTRLLSKCWHYDTAQEVFQEIITEGLEPDRFTYNALISKCTHYAEAADLLREMKKKNVYADLMVYNTLMGRCSTYDQGLEMMTALKKDEMMPDFTTYDRFLSVCERSGQAVSIFGEMRLLNIVPDTRMYRKALAVCKTYMEANILFDHMDRDGVVPGYEMYNALLSKNVVFTELMAGQFLIRIKNYGHALTREICRKLIVKCGSFDEALKVFQKIKAQQTSLRGIHSFLLSKCNNYDDIITLRAIMEQDGQRLDQRFYNVSLNKCTEFQCAKAILMEMQDKKVRVEEAALNKAMNLTDASYDEVKNVGQMLSCRGRGLSERFYVRLVLKSVLERSEIDPDIFVLAKKDDVTLDLNFFYKLLQSCKSWQVVRTIMGCMKEIKIVLDNREYAVILHKLKTFPDWMSLLKQMRIDGLSPSNKTYASLFFRTKIPAEREIMFDYMAKSGQTPDCWLLDTLIRMASTFEEAYAMFKFLTGRGIIPLYTTYSNLMWKSETFAQAEMLCIECLKTDVTPELTFYFHFLERCSCVGEITKVVTVVEDLGYVIEQSIYYSRLLYTSSFAEARELFNKRKGLGMIMTRRAYHNLFLKCKSTREIQTVFSAMQINDFIPSF